MKNKYRFASLIALWFSVVLAGAMIIYTIIAYKNYLNHPEYSAPFSLNLIIISACYGIPIIIGLSLYFIFKRKVRK